MGNLQQSFRKPFVEKTDFKLLYISASKYEGDWQSQPHTHHFTELFYILNGEGSFLIENGLIPVKKNDLIIVNPHIEHTEKSVGKQPLEYIVFGVEGLSFTFKDEKTARDYAVFNYRQEKNKLLSLLHIMLEEIEKKEYNYELVCHHLLDVLVLFITRSQNLVITPTLTSKMPKECGLMKRYLDVNYADNITLDSLADLTHMNKFYLVHSFTKVTGMSPITYLTKKRIEAAMNLLTDTDHSIAQVASGVGFSSQSYFSQIFKKETGKTPNQYRRENT